jgi:hypothetical protein
MKNKAFTFWTIHGPAFTPEKPRRRVVKGSFAVRLLRFAHSKMEVKP